MKYITGIFKGNYQGKEVESYSLQTIAALHHLHIDPGAAMYDCEWTTDYNNLQTTHPFIKVNSISNTDFHFNNHRFPEEKDFRGDLHSCILINPVIYNITHKEGYTYGTIKGILLGTIGISEVTPVTELKNYYAPVKTPLQTPALLTTSVISKEIGKWNWSGFFTFLFWLALGIGILSWLINHRGCNKINVPDLDDMHISKTDSIAIKDDNDTVQLHDNNTTFSVYDWSLEDNDTISLLLNGKMIRKDIPLTNSIISWIEPALSPGENILVINSVNNGTVGPASPTIEINDGMNTQAFQVRVYKGSPKKIHLQISQ